MKLKVRKMNPAKAQEFTERIAARAAAVAIGTILQRKGTIEDAEEVLIELIHEVRRRCATPAARGRS